jgi:hypothetical protein
MASNHRFLDTNLLEQDFMEELPMEQMLLFVFIVLKCNDGGIYRVDAGGIRRLLRTRTIIDLDEFLEVVNADKERIIVVDRDNRGKHKTWFVRGFFKWQYGVTFKYSNPHIGSLRKMINAGVHPRFLDGVDIGKLQPLDFQSIVKVAYMNPKTRLEQGFYYAIDNLKDQDQDNNNTYIHTGGAAEKKFKERKPEQPKESPLVALAPPKPETKPEPKPEPKPATRPVYLVQEDMDIDLVKEKVYSDAEFIANFTRNWGLTQVGVYEWLTAFNRLLAFTGQRQKMEKDYRYHFGNWLKSRDLESDPKDYSPIPPKPKRSETMKQPITRAPKLTTATSKEKIVTKKVGDFNSEDEMRERYGVKSKTKTNGNSSNSNHN